MSIDEPFRAVYRVINGQEIDADIYLPKVGRDVREAICPILINIHGGAFMLGSSDMVNRDQINDCLGRQWIVVVPNHRLCPQVNILEGPMEDCRDLLLWIHRGELQKLLLRDVNCSHVVDLDHVFAFGTSSGGTLALSLGFGVPRPVTAIFDMYGPSTFSNPFWTTKIPTLLSQLPSHLTDDFINRVFDEKIVPIKGGVSLEGQQPNGPDFADPRQAYALMQIANGTLMEAIFPQGDWSRIDPAENISAHFPPTFIAHGIDDEMVPISLTRLDIWSQNNFDIKVVIGWTA
ncbi:unnamed protein product [Clonostachys rosea]|uniref:BD-FAE-like domain-containing protein n=1 Tax=Bionectria ochroleuca TaxID=29856 RepID=A0ABY6URX0_BIOOC|nr:unnamed protein product [Clonostachys rosea]